jgi:regulator of cell morphogenesis and NO signaling
MLIDETKTVRDLVIENPAVARVFEKFQIDYCCGGQLSLAEACRRSGVKLDEVLQAAEKATINETRSDLPEMDFNEMSLTALTDYIVRKHHKFTREQSEKISVLLEKVCSIHGKNHAELFDIQKVFSTLRLEVEKHMLKEERMLFPYISLMESLINFGHAVPPAPFGSTKNPIRVMITEHDAAGEHLLEIRRLSNHFVVPDDACVTYRTLYRELEAFEKDLHWHTHLENNILFPKAIEMEASGKSAEPEQIAEVKCGLDEFSSHESMLRSKI